MVAIILEKLTFLLPFYVNYMNSSLSLQAKYQIAHRLDRCPKLYVHICIPGNKSSQSVISFIT